MKQRASSAPRSPAATASGATRTSVPPATALRSHLRIPEPFVLGPFVTADAPEASLVPTAGDLNVTAVAQGLGAHA